MLEYSEYNNKYYSEKDAHNYYGGPLMYYKADGTRQFGSIIELQSQKEVAIEDITPLVRRTDADSLGSLNFDNFFKKPYNATLKRLPDLKSVYLRARLY